MTENSQEDFIAVFDGVIDPSECQKIIEFYEKLKSMNLTFDRQQMNDKKPHQKNDETAFLLDQQILNIDSNPILIPFVENFWKCYAEYVNVFSVLLESEMHGINSIRLQKTLPGQGYHSWHFEASDSTSSRRIIAWTLYLNDVQEGGETEFLYQRKRVAAKAGRLAIWPSAFTHTHRGNPPLSNEKYILTGWLEYFGKASNV
jgi:hypothetical protein